MDHVPLTVLFLLLGVIPPAVAVAVFVFGYDFVDMFPFIMTSLTVAWAATMLSFAYTVWKNR